MRGEYFSKEVFLCLPSLLRLPWCVVYHCVGMYPAYICICVYKHMYVDEYITMPVLSKKVIIKIVWADLLYLAFLDLRELACFHWELCLLVSGHSSTSSFHCRSPDHQELQDLNWSVGPSACCHDIVFLSDLICAPLGQTLRKSSAFSVPCE